MKTLVKKEARLLLPAFASAFLLAALPGRLLPSDFGGPGPLGFGAFCFGAIMLALSPFGREFGLNTFTLILAQPSARTRIWWTKTAVLATALVTVLVVWWLSYASVGRLRK